MDQALCSILCDQDNWTWEPYIQVHIKFHKDGSGEVYMDSTPVPGHYMSSSSSADYVDEKLSCLGDHIYYLAVNFTWKSIPLPQPDQVAEAANTKTIWGTKPQLLGKLSLEMTLNQGVPNGITACLPWSNCAKLNEKHLSEAAFRTKSFTVAVEKGNFLPTCWIGCADEYKLHCGSRYGLRLLFDQSPYPSRAECNNPDEGILAGAQWWGCTEFVARTLPKSEDRKTAMNDIPSAYSWGRCVVN